MNGISKYRWAATYVAAASVMLLPACADRDAPRVAENVPECDPVEARQIVEAFGDRLNDVSVLAPDSMVTRQMADAYGALVTPSLLRRWQADPSAAPGRTVSSPWPDHIEVESVRSTDDGCRVDGEVVLVTSVEAARGSGGIGQPVRMLVVEEDGWRIAEYEDEGLPATPATPPAPDSSGSSPDGTTVTGADPAVPSEPTAADAAEVLREYYDAIDTRDYRRAFAIWGNDGAQSGQTFDEFASGFSETASVNVDVGEPGRVEPAAGSRYVEIPVVITAETSAGEAQRFEGTYVLRRTVMPGAPADHRQWHIYSAEIAPSD